VKLLPSKFQKPAPFQSQKFTHFLRERWYLEKWNSASRNYWKHNSHPVELAPLSRAGSIHTLEARNDIKCSEKGDGKEVRLLNKNVLLNQSDFSYLMLALHLKKRFMNRVMVLNSAKMFGIVSRRLWDLIFQIFHIL